MSSPTDKDPAVRVVDRRWWARNESTPADESGARKPTYIEELEQRLNDSTTQLQSVLTEHRRSLEEFEQVKSRMRREVARDVERGRRALLTEFLDVLDNLDRALAAAREPGTGDRPVRLETVGKGVELVRDQFLAKLASFGVTRLQALGEPFNADQHEAVTTTPVLDANQDGRVISVIRDGYRIGEELLRPAAVVVGKYPA